MADDLTSAIWTGFLRDVEFALGERVRKRSGAEWRGTVVGYYSTKLTPRGVCVESETHVGSVQIYPTHALMKA